MRSIWIGSAFGSERVRGALDSAPLTVLVCGPKQRSRLRPTYLGKAPGPQLYIKATGPVREPFASETSTPVRRCQAPLTGAVMHRAHTLCASLPSPFVHPSSYSCTSICL